MEPSKFTSTKNSAETNAPMKNKVTILETIVKAKRKSIPYTSFFRSEQVNALTTRCDAQLYTNAQANNEHRWRSLSKNNQIKKESVS